MSADFVYLQDLVEFINGDRGKNYPKEKDFVGVGTGVQFISAADLQEGQIRKDGGKWITQVAFDKLGSGKVRKHDLLFCLRGSLGRVAEVTDESQAAIASSLVILRCKQGVNKDWLLALLQTPTIQFEIGILDNGSVQGNISATSLKKLKLPNHSVEAQTKIAALSNTLNSYVRNLQSQNTTLEALAQTLFRSWFVNFDPVHAKAAGQTPEGMSPELAALFPSEFVESELGMIPKGWSVCSLEKFAHLNQKSWGKTEHPDLISYLDLSSVKKNNLDTPHVFLYEEAPSRARRVLRKGDSIFGTVRPGNLSYGYISDEVESLTGSTGFAVLTPKREELRAFVYCCMTDPSNVERLTHQADGAAYPAVNPSVVLEQELATPTHQELFTWFGKICNPLFEQIGINRDLSINLTCLRDELLPRLISGKLRIEEAEEAVAEVLGSTTEEVKAA